MLTHEQREELMEKIGVFVLVLLTILFMFVLYMVLDEWRANQQISPANQPQALLTEGMLACVELGCPPGTQFVGSRQSDLYHECDSSYARAIKKENLLCFKDASDAVAQGYRKGG